MVIRLTLSGLHGAGYAFCFALDITGKLYSWGYNGYGVLAHGNTTNLSVPTEITGVTFDNSFWCGKIKKLLVDSQQSYQRVAILTEKGKIYWCGRNEYGWAMMGNTSDVNTFTQMGNGQEVELTQAQLICGLLETADTQVSGLKTKKVKSSVVTMVTMN